MVKVPNGQYGVSSSGPTGLSWNRKSPSSQGPEELHNAYVIKPRKSLILVRIADELQG